MHALPVAPVPVPVPLVADTDARCETTAICVLAVTVPSRAAYISAHLRDFPALSIALVDACTPATHVAPLAAYAAAAAAASSRRPCDDEEESPAALMCLASHLKALAAAAASGEDWCLIVEDDARLHVDASAALRALLEHAARQTQFDVLAVGYSPSRSGEFFTPALSAALPLRPPGRVLAAVEARWPAPAATVGCFGTVAYLVRSAAAARLLSACGGEVRGDDPAALLALRARVDAMGLAAVPLVADYLIHALLTRALSWPVLAIEAAGLPSTLGHDWTAAWAAAAHKGHIRPAEYSTTAVPALL